MDYPLVMACRRLRTWIPRVTNLSFLSRIHFRVMPLDQAEALLEKIRSYPDYRIYLVERDGVALGTFALLIAWYTVLAPSSPFPISLVLLVLVTPLLFPLRGLLHGRSYTFAWSAFLALLYFIHGVAEAWHTAPTRILGMAEVGFTTLWFVSAIAYIQATKQPRS